MHILGQRRRIFWVLASMLCGALGVTPNYSARATEAPLVAVAANLQLTINAIAAKFHDDTGHAVKLGFGASGNIARQIEQGAPFEMFLSADEDSVFRIADQGLTMDRGALYAVGRLVLFVPAGSPLFADPTLADLRAAAGDGRLKRLAIANPELAPYGKAAMQVLQKFDLWAGMSGKLVKGENVGQAAQFTLSGSVQAAILPYALALAPELAKAGTSVLLPADWHAPLRQRMVLTKKAGAVAKSFYAYMQSATAQKLLTESGYTLPEAAN